MLAGPWGPTAEAQSDQQMWDHVQGSLSLRRHGEEKQRYRGGQSWGCEGAAFRFHSSN